MSIGTSFDDLDKTYDSEAMVDNISKTVQFTAIMTEDTNRITCKCYKDNSESLNTDPFTVLFVVAITQNYLMSPAYQTINQIYSSNRNKYAITEQ